jgi:hypothetical protein
MKCVWNPLERIEMYANFSVGNPEAKNPGK